MAHILILDDDEGIGQILQMFLEDEGHTPRLFSQGHDALAYLRDQSLPHVVITDYRMPGMMGDEFLRRALQVCEDIPHRYLMFAACPFHDIPLETRTLLEDHHIPFLLKPFVIEDILKYVNACR